MASPPGRRKPVEEVISPELCLVDPELAARARRLLPETVIDGFPKLKLASVANLRLPGAARRRPARPIGHETRRRRPVTTVERRRHEQGADAAAPPAARPRYGRRRSMLAVCAAATMGLIVTLGAAGSADRPKALEPYSVAAQPTSVQKVLTVPHVCGLAYVFAKGLLEERGFAWRVSGPVGGFAGNRVVDQHPRPGTNVADSGAPLVLLTLQRAGDYEERGVPEPTSWYAPTRAEIVVPTNSRWGLSSRVTECSDTYDAGPMEGQASLSARPE